VRALVVYESMFGNTRTVAEEIGAGLRTAYDVEVVAVGDLEVAQVDSADLVVVGAPTHAWGLSRPNTRRAAEQQTGESGPGLHLEPGATGPGIREWLAALPPTARQVAAFDTRISAPRFLTGHASTRIARALRRTGGRLVAPPESFLVTRQNRLVDGERERARRWATDLATRRGVPGRQT
jgi:hypothetical protein